ncbi:MAG: sulfotransferase [Saprospiraceae bacterium]|nr:sulfotransferase [Saprospiraceae bacterium]
MNINKQFSWSLKQNWILPILYGRKFKKDFLNAPVFTLFLGNSRSGTTLIASLLDAHPNMVISHELDILRMLHTPIGKLGLYGRIFNKSRWFASNDAQWQTYSYRVPTGWQGRFDQLLVIGDKKAHHSCVLLHQDPSLLMQLEQKVQVPIRIIHVIRNPFDNITTKARKGAQRQLEAPLEKLREVADVYFRNIGIVEVLKKRGHFAVHEIQFETFLHQPEMELKALCTFLGTTCPPDYLSACLTLVNPQAHQSRHDVEWPEDLKQDVLQRASQYESLSGYQFDQ